MRFLAGEAGIDQFLDIGAGLPSLGGTHQAAPDARVLYADHDPQVVAHANILLAEQGAADATYVHGGLRQPGAILDAAATVLELGRPVGLILSGVMAIPCSLRTPAQIAEFFDGLELVEPGVVSCPRWRPEPGDDLSEVDAFGGVGRKTK